MNPRYQYMRRVSPLKQVQRALSIHTHVGHRLALVLRFFVWLGICNLLFAPVEAQTPATVYQFSITAPDGSSGYAPNGNITHYSDLVNGTWTLGYDTLNRLTSSSQTIGSGSPQYGCWSYDTVGNITAQATSDQPFVSAACQPPAGANYSIESPQFGDGTNRITGGTWRSSNGIVSTGVPGYDNGGNLSNDGQSSYKYDLDGHVCAVRAASGALYGYLYDASGHRVAKGGLTAFSCDPTANGFQATSTFAIGPDGDEMTEVDGSGNPVHTNVSASGMLLATYQPNGIHFQLTDWLRTKRAQTNYLGQLEEACQSQPFGDGLTCQTASSASEASERHFTGKERDTESGLDYFGARYYSSVIGRFTSPDYEQLPDPVPYADFSNPQSLNLYSYGGNNPVSNADANGHDVNVCTSDGNGGQHCALISNEQYQQAQQGNNGGLNVPSLDSVGTNGSENITDSSGNTVGTATYVSNGGFDFYGNQAGFNQLANTSRVVTAGTAIYAGVYGGAFLGASSAAGLAGLGSSAITLGVSSGPAIFVAGQVFEHYFETNAGEVGFLGEVEVSGSTLILKDVAVYPTGTSGSLNVGTGQVMQGLHQLESMARSQGFSQLQIQGTRLTGASAGTPAALVNITRNLR